MPFTRNIANSGPISPRMLTVCSALNGKCRRRQFIVSTATFAFLGGSSEILPLPTPFLAQCDGARKFSGVERGKVLDALADPDGMDRKAKLCRNCDQDSAPGSTVQLGH